MTRKKYLLALVFLVSLVLFRDVTGKEKTVTIYLPPSREVFQDIPFDVGETIVYNVSWAGINAGIATMTINRRVIINGVETFHIILRARTNRFFSLFFKVDDRIESYFDCKSLYSLRFEKLLREGRYREHRKIEYDHKQGLFNMVHEKKGKKGCDKGIIPFWVKDPISSIFYLRARKLEVGKSFSMIINAEGKNYNVEVDVIERENIKTRIGRLDTIVVKPSRLGWQGRVFEKNKSSLTIWISDDEYRLPVLLKGKVKIGSLKFELKEWKKPGSIGKLTGTGSKKDSVKSFMKTVMKKSPLTATSERKELLVRPVAQNYLVSIE